MRVERIVEEGCALEDRLVIARATSVNPWLIAQSPAHSGATPISCGKSAPWTIVARSESARSPASRSATSCSNEQRPFSSRCGYRAPGASKPGAPSRACTAGHVLRPDEEDLGLGIEEPPDQPAGRGPVHVDPAAGDPLHGAVYSSCSKDQSTNRSRNTTPVQGLFGFPHVSTSTGGWRPRSLSCGRIAALSPTRTRTPRSSASAFFAAAFSAGASSAACGARSSPRRFERRAELGVAAWRSRGFPRGPRRTARRRSSRCPAPSRPLPA